MCRLLQESATSLLCLPRWGPSVTGSCVCERILAASFASDGALRHGQIFLRKGPWATASAHQAAESMHLPDTDLPWFKRLQDGLEDSLSAMPENTPLSQLSTGERQRETAEQSNLVDCPPRILRAPSTAARPPPVVPAGQPGNSRSWGKREK